MPLSKKTAEEYKPRLEQALDDIADIHGKRMEKEAADLVKYQRQRADQELNIAPSSQETIRQGLNFLVWRLGEMLGIEKDHRQYLLPQDLSLLEIQQILLTEVPDELRDLSIRLISEIQNRKVLHVLGANLHVDGSRQPRGNQSPFTDELSRIVNTGAATYMNYNSNDVYHTQNTNFDVISKIRVSPGEEDIPMPTISSNNEVKGIPNTRIYLEGTQLGMDRWRQGKEGKQLSHQMLYKSTVSFLGDHFEGTRMIGINGSIIGTSLDSCTVTTREGLNMKACEWLGGGLHIDEVSDCNFETHFFFGTEISISDQVPTNSTATPIFKSCDFSHANISDEDLEKIIPLCQKGCIFSENQLARMEESDRNQFLSSQQALLNITNLTNERDGTVPLRVSRYENDVIGRIPVGMVDDSSDRSREDIELLQTIQNANINRQYRTSYSSSELIVDERIFPGLRAQKIDHLVPRTRFFHELAVFVKKLGDQKQVPYEEMMKFVIESDGLDFQKIMGFNSGTGQLPMNLLSLPFLDTNSSDRDDKTMYVGMRNGRFERLHSFPGSWRSEHYQPTYYAHVKQLARSLKDLGARLYHYGVYLNKLLEEQGYRFPELIEGETYRFEGIYHPELPQQLEAKGLDRSTMVLNDVEFTGSERGEIIFLTGPNGKAGKTHLMHALTAAVAQAQSGAPCPGKVKVPEKGMFDQILVMPNLRAKAGSEESGMMSRARVVLEEFIARIQAAAEESVKPIRVLIALDEIMMGVTRPQDARRIECNFIEEIMTTEGVIPTVIVVSPDEKVVHSLKNRFPEEVKILAPSEEGPLSKLVPSDEPAMCSAELVLEEKGLSRFLEGKDWMIND